VVVHLHARKKLVIANFNRQSITFSKDTRMPHDFEEGEWNVFSSTNEVQLQRLLAALFEFTTECTGPQQKLVCDEPDTEEGVVRCNTASLTEEVEEHVAHILTKTFPHFTPSQRHAVLATLRETYA